jgi:hypothetical protein
LTSAEKTFYKKYGKTQAEVDAMSQVCMICGAAPKTRRLDTDHDHRFKYYKIVIKPGLYKNFWAGISELGLAVMEPTRKAARERVKFLTKGRSIRGRLCHRCNRGLQMFLDSPRRLRAAADYLEAFAKRTGVSYD